jgi:hypothetical protein
LALSKDAPEPRPIRPPEYGGIVWIPVLGGCITDTSDVLRKCSISDNASIGRRMLLYGDHAPDLVIRSSIDKICPGKLQSNPAGNR